MIDPKLNALLSAHQAGHFTLPGDLTKLVATVRTLEAARTEARREWNMHAAKRTGARAQAIDALIAAAGADEPLPDASAVVEVEQRHNLLQTTVQLREEAVTEASGDLATYVSGHSDDIIRTHLKPCFHECLERACKSMKALDGLAIDAE
jgi:hypothetical protein